MSLTLEEVFSLIPDIGATIKAAEPLFTAAEAGNVPGILAAVPAAVPAIEKLVQDIEAALAKKNAAVVSAANEQANPVS